MREPIAVDFGSCRVLMSSAEPGLGVALLPEILALESADEMAPAEILLDLGDVQQWCDLFGCVLAVEGERLRRGDPASGYLWAVVRSEEDLDGIPAMIADGVHAEDIARWERHQASRDHVAELLEQCNLERHLLERV